MNEYLSNHLEKEAIEQKKREYIALAKELAEHQEGFSFPGVTPEAYSALKRASDEYPEYSTPIDELLEKYRAQGIKIVLSKDPESGVIFVLPRNSDDVQMDNISPRQLQLTDGMDDKLRKLIILNTEHNDMVK